MLDKALIAAIEAKDDAAVRDLLKRGASPHTLDADGWPALLYAIAEGTVDAVKALLEHGADPLAQIHGDGALHMAAERGDVAIAKMLIERGAGADVNRRGDDLVLPLNIAAEQGNLEMIKLLMDAGANPELSGGLQAMTALGRAAVCGHPQAVQLLLDRGADVAGLDLDRSDATRLAMRAYKRNPSKQLDEAIRVLLKAQNLGTWVLE